MDFLEFIGFLVSLIAFIALAYLRIRSDQKRQKDPSGYAKEEIEKKKRLKAFLKSLEMDMEENEEEEEELLPPPTPPPKKPPRPPTLAYKPPPKPKTMDDFTFATSYEEKRQKTAIEQRTFRSALDERYKEMAPSLRYLRAPSYEVHRTYNPSYAEKMLNAAPSMKHIIIYQAILGPPRGLSPWK